MGDGKRGSPFGLRARLRKALGRSERATPSGPVEVRFVGGPSGEVQAGTTLLAAAAQLGMTLSSYCGGHCSCGTCRVAVVSGADNLSDMAGNEQMVLGSAARARGDRLACQSRVLGPVTVEVPDWF